MTVGYLPSVAFQKKPVKRKKSRNFRNYAFSFPQVVEELTLRGWSKESAVREIIRRSKQTYDTKLETAISVQILHNRHTIMTRLIEQMCNEEGYDPALRTIKNIKSGKLELRDECYFDMKLRDALLKEKGETLNIKHEGLAGVLAGIGDDGGGEDES